MLFYERLREHGTQPDMSHTALTTPRMRLGPALAVAGTVITWAAAFPAIRLALHDMAPLPLAAARFAIAAVLGIGWLAWRRPGWPPLRDLGIVAMGGVLGIAAYNALLNSGQSTVSAGAASFIVNTQPLFMAVLAVVLLGERFSRWSWAGTAIGFAGIATIAAGQPGGLQFGGGSSLILLAAFSAAVYFVLQRPLFARHHPLTVTSMVVIAGAVALLPWLPEGVRQAGQASREGLGALFFLALAPAAIGQVCWTFALRAYGAARAGQFLYLVPAIATSMAFIAIGEIPSAFTLMGGALALIGVVVVNTWGRR